MRKLKQTGLTLLIASTILSGSTFYALADEAPIGPGYSGSRTEQAASLTEVITFGPGSTSITGPGNTESPIGPGYAPQYESNSEQPADPTTETVEFPTADQTEVTPPVQEPTNESVVITQTPIDTPMVQDTQQYQIGPLSVPHRTPQFQTTVLLGELMEWSAPYLNDTPVTYENQTIRSISTYLEGIHGDLLYRAYTTSGGWTDWAMNGQQTGLPIGWPPIEAIQYRFAGPVADQYDIYYTASISDGSYTSWAKNGDTCGTMNQNNYITGFRLMFYEKGTAPEMDLSKPVFAPHQDGIQYIDGVMRYIHADGSNYTGWGWIGEDRYYFADSYPVTGWHYIDGYKYYFGEDGKLWTDVEPLIGNAGPFQIMINKQANCLTVYAKDESGKFAVPVKSFLVSTGDDTPLGTFTTPEKYRWRLMINDVWTQYATRLGSGLSILMHSIIYDAPDPFTVWASTYNNLGIARSAGCIRLTTADSKWIYDNCPVGTTVIVYEDPIPGPFDRPTIEAEIPFEQRWDPTDPNLTQEAIDAKAQEILTAHGY